MSYSRNSSQDLIYNSYSNTYELASRLYTLTIDSTPSDATITFVGGIVSGNSVSDLYNTEISYTITREGYKTKSGNFTLNHDETLSIILDLRSSDSFMKGGGGGQPTYLKIPIETTTRLFAWEDNPLTIRAYTISENPSVYEPLYNQDGIKLTDYIISGKKNKTILIKNKTNNVVVEASYSKVNNTNKTIANSIFYKNGGGGSGARGENWVTGLSENPRKGGAGGGYYWLNTDTLELTSVDGRDAGENDNSLDVGLFPNVHSGKGGASGTGQGATVVEQKTNYYDGIGATGANSAHNQYSGQADAYFGSGGGGAGGDEDASGGRAGEGNSDYIDNTTGENATNYHTVPTASTNYLKQSSILGQGGKAANGFISADNGHNGWLYIYKYEKEFQIFDMGMVNGDAILIKPDIDARYITDPIDEDKTMDGGEDFDSSNYLNAGVVFYEEEFRNCGEISDDNIEETIKLGGI